MTEAQASGLRMGMDEDLWHQLVSARVLTADDLIVVQRRLDEVQGAIDTAIHEYCILDPAMRRDLKTLLAQWYGWPVARLSALESPDRRAVALLPRALADQHGLLALSATADELVIASSGCDPEAVAEVAFAVGRTPRMHLAFEGEIRGGLASLLGVEPPERIQRLNTRGAGYLARPPSHARVIALPSVDIPQIAVTESGRMRVVKVSAPDDATLPEMPAFRPGQSQPMAPPPDRDQVLDAVGRLVTDAGSAEDVQLLVDAGGLGLDALMRVFPGQLRLDRFTVDPNMIKPSAYSAIIDAVIRFGTRAAPRLELLLDEVSPELRYCALACFLAIRSPASLPVIARRLFDGDAAVRQMAIAVLDRQRDERGFDQVVTFVRDRLQSSKPVERRAAAEAASALRLSAVCELLFDQLQDASCAQAAQRALVEICHQDFGRSVWQWRSWYERNRHLPRVEWLLAGMKSEQQVIRAASARELERLTFQNYGFSAVAPPDQRDAAIDRWRAWWARTGRRQFGQYH